MVRSLLESGSQNLNQDINQRGLSFQVRIVRRSVHRNIRRQRINF